MKLIKTITPLLLTSFLISCGDNTTTSPLVDIASISIDDTNISIRATDAPKSLKSTVTYTDGSTANGSADMAWSSSDENIFSTSSAAIYATHNGGDANLSIDYRNTFQNATPSLVHVAKLISINYGDLNISDVGNPQTISISGNFENNETNITMENNILWSTDGNATFTEVNATHLTLTVDYNVTSIVLSAALFSNTENEVDFNKTFY